MFVHISPSERDLSETLSSLNFATRVRGVELGPAKRQVDTSELQKMKTMVGLVTLIIKCRSVCFPTILFYYKIDQVFDFKYF